MLWDGRRCGGGGFGGKFVAGKSGLSVVGYLIDMRGKGDIGRREEEKEKCKLTSSIRSTVRVLRMKAC